MKEIRKELNRVIAELLLSLFMSFNIFGAGIEVDPNVPQNVNVDRAPNGVPVINISTPTDKGTSVNSFKEFNVDQRGVEILNNTGVGRGYLSGIVNPNPNLRPGQEARTVVFKVTGANRSEIEGYISALSPRPINLFIANENGIYVNGGGFINVNRAALVTGKINIQDGDVVSFTTRDGKVIIGEKGLDISNVERVDIITRTQELTGKIVGQKDVNIILGQNEVNLAGIVTPIITSDNKPALALNGGALGSIYSNGQVNIISTEKGVGVNLKSSVLSENDIRMKINGNADVKEIISKNAEIQTEDLKTDKINANNLSIRAKDYENRNEITAQNVNISSSNLKNNELTAGNLTLNTGNTESNRISANSVNIKGNNLKSNILEGQNISLAISNNINNTGNILANNLDINSKNLNSNGITADNLKINSETISSNKIEAGNTDIKGINLTTDKLKSRNINLDISRNIINTKNITGSKVNINTGDIKNNEIISDELNLNATKNIDSNAIYSNTAKINAQNLDSNSIEGQNISLAISNNINNKGNILADNLNISSKDITSNEIKANKINIDSKNVTSKKLTSNEAKIKVESFVNNEKTDSKSADFDIQKNFENKGTLAVDNLTLKADNVNNDGKISTDKAKININKNIINNNEIASNDLTLKTENLINNKNITAGKANITATKDTTNNGLINGNDITVSSQNIINNKKIEADKLTTKATGITENKGELSANEYTSTTTDFVNGNIVSVGKGTINATNTIRNDNKINANELTATSKTFVNNKKVETGKGNITATENIENNDLIAANDLTLKGKNIINAKGKTIFTTNELTANASESIVNNGAEILSQGKINLTAATVDNKVGKIKGSGLVDITANVVNNIGKAGDLTKYKKYWEAWDGTIYTDETKMMQRNQPGSWERNYYADPSNEGDKWQVFHNWLTGLKKPEEPSYIAKNMEDIVKNRMRANEDGIMLNSAEFPIIPLVNKIESEAQTEFAVISGGDVKITSTGEVNNIDGIISSDGLTKVDAPKIVNRVTIDTNNPVQLRDGMENLKWWYHKSKHSKKSTYYVGYYRFLSPTIRTAYVAGQPSVIEGKILSVDTSKIVGESYEEAKGKLSTNPTYSKNVDKQNIEIVKNISGITEVKNTGIIPINISGINTGNTGISQRNGINIGSLYVPSTDPSSRYVIENRTEFITRGNYYGGDYFLSRMGYVEDWDRVKLLGDAYYDNMLIEQTLTEKLGTRYINGLSGEELTKQLIDNATTAKKDLQLRQGVALTKDQINNLKNDIIWYEYETVNGKKTLVPKIYLSKATIEKLEVDGRSKMYGTDYTLVNVKGDYENKGLKIGSTTGVTLVKANKVRNETVANERAEITGRQVRVTALEGNIENVGGKIVSVERTELIAKNGDIINNGTKVTKGYDLGENFRSKYEELGNIGEISGPAVYLEANNYNSTGGALATKNLELQLTGNINENALKLNGDDRFGQNSSNYQTYKSKEHIGSGIVAEKATGKVGDINLKGSAFVVEDGKGLKVGNVKAESLVNEYDVEKRTKEKGILSKRESLTQSHTEENVSSNFKIGENADIKGTVTGIGSNIYIGDNSYVGGKVTTDSRELHNTYYNEEKKSGFSASAKGTSVSAGYGKSKNTYDEKSTINAKSSLHVGNNTVLNNGASITATDFEHGKIEINNGDVTYGARKDTRDVSTSSKSSYIGVTASVKSPALDRVKQAKEAVDQIKKGDTVGGAVNAVNFVTGTVSGMRGNITRPDGGRATRKDIEAGNYKSNNDFYVQGSVNVGFNTSKSETKSHEESAVVTTIKGIDGNSSITYNNVKNINYIGTQAKDTKFIYNNVENINKEAVELHKSYESKSKGFGISAGATVGYGHKL